uniref:Ig-like domain-containing protein n=1 Tax=Gasterosteus aculeatus aculeatus TaxID=481459 RepID=A0AAQ4S298_GASAC
MIVSCSRCSVCKQLSQRYALKITDHLHLFYVSTWFSSFSFVANPPDPILTHSTAIQGRPFTITCSVTHTCPSHVPELTWNRATTDDVVTVVHKKNRFGYWEMESILAFTPEEKDDHSEIICTAAFFGGRNLKPCRISM